MTRDASQTDNIAKVLASNMPTPEYRRELQERLDAMQAATERMDSPRVLVRMCLRCGGMLDVDGHVACRCACSNHEPIKWTWAEAER